MERIDPRIKAVEFDEERHKYFFGGKELRGVTGAIGKLLGKSFPDTDTVRLAALYGSDVHKEIENYFNLHGLWFGDGKLSTEGAKWAVEELKRFCDENGAESVECEVMVSDFEGTASKVDVVVRSRDGKAWLFDVKTTSRFDREYCSLQLSVYKRLFEECYGSEALGMFVLGTKSRRLFRILEREPAKVERILAMNRRA